MSFSSKVKEELSAHFGKGSHCTIAEAAAFVNICGQTLSFGEDFCLKIQTENLVAAKKCFTLLQNAFNIIADVSIRSSGHKQMYTLFVRGHEDTERILAQIIHFQLNMQSASKEYACCCRAYIRGAFIAAGSVNDPEKNYHLEFALTKAAIAEELLECINSFGLDAKLMDRKEYFIVYVKEGEQIVDLLNIMEAPLALMDLENVRIVKEMRNDINRRVNCETANLNKVVGAAVKQLEDITYIQNTIGLSSLPEQLQEVAHIRLEYPDKSLKELGSYLMTPVGKSGVNHRLRKISNIAETLREGKGEQV